MNPHATPADPGHGAPFIDPAVVRRAAEWMARLWSGEASEADVAACARWRAEHPDHEQAWRRLQVMEDKLHSVPAAVARRALRDGGPSASRRRMLAVVGLGAAAGAAAGMLGGRDLWLAAAADYRAATGEIRDLVLPDGTRLVLDTGSAVDVRYDVQVRRVVLRAGRVLAETAPDAAGRPFFIDSPQGTVQALGTVFSVQSHAHACQVAVYEGMVEVRPAHAAGHAVRARAGQRIAFSAEHAGDAVPDARTEPAWTRGQLVADDLRLADLLAELARYRRGVLRCDPEVAGLRVTGVFPLRDTDKALRNLEVGLPVRVSFLGPYWVRVRARQPGRLR